jgi:hypothetical protein
MPLSFTVHENDAYLHCVASGAASFADNDFDEAQAWIRS